MNPIIFSLLEIVLPGSGCIFRQRWQAIIPPCRLPMPPRYGALQLPIPQGYESRAADYQPAGTPLLSSFPSMTNRRLP
ncbi:MAG: hypothetical protein ACJ8G3_13695 [Burkholderiaceae bacterium]